MEAKEKLEALEARLDAMAAALDAILEELRAIHSLQQRLPEIQAAVALQMRDAAESAKREGLSPRDIWEVLPPYER